MSTDHFSTEFFFDLSGFAHRDIFGGCQFVWEAVPKVEEYVSNIFKSGKLKANFGEDIYLGEGTEVEPGVYIEGPTIIGKNCRLGHAAYLRKGVILGDNCILGHAVEVKNSIFLNGAVAAHLNYIGDSIIGNDVNIGAGALLANFRLDGKTIRVKMDNKFHETNLVKFGSIVGDSSKLGVNSVLNPGTLLGKRSLVYPLTSAIGHYPHESKIR